MIKNYMQVAIRYFIKDRIYASINIIGFIISLTFALLLLVWVMDEFSYEQEFTNADQIHRVVEIAKVKDELIKTPKTYLRKINGHFLDADFFDDVGVDPLAVACAGNDGDIRSDSD